jgi:hypothetical protein
MTKIEGLEQAVKCLKDMVDALKAESPKKNKRWKPN